MCVCVCAYVYTLSMGKLQEVKTVKEKNYEELYPFRTLLLF